MRGPVHYANLHNLGTNLLEVTEDAPVGDEDDEEWDEEPEGHQVQRVRKVRGSMPGWTAAAKKLHNY